jgi:hypothetical protein
VRLERADQLSETDGTTRYPVSAGRNEGKVQLCDGYFPNFTSRGFHMNIFSNQPGAIFPLLETFNKYKCSLDLSAHAWDVQIHRISMILRRFTPFGFQCDSDTLRLLSNLRARPRNPTASTSHFPRPIFNPPITFLFAHLFHACLNPCPLPSVAAPARSPDLLISVSTRARAYSPPAASPHPSTPTVWHFTGRSGPNRFPADATLLSRSANSNPSGPLRSTCRPPQSGRPFEPQRAAFRVLGLRRRPEVETICLRSSRSC